MANSIKDESYLWMKFSRGKC